jgi:hypothetical protein
VRSVKIGSLRDGVHFEISGKGGQRDDLDMTFEQSGDGVERGDKEC